MKKLILLVLLLPINTFALSMSLSCSSEAYVNENFTCQIRAYNSTLSGAQYSINYPGSVSLVSKSNLSGSQYFNVYDTMGKGTFEAVEGSISLASYQFKTSGAGSYTISVSCDNIVDGEDFENHFGCGSSSATVVVKERPTTTTTTTTKATTKVTTKAANNTTKATTKAQINNTTKATVNNTTKGTTTTKKADGTTNKTQTTTTTKPNGIETTTTTALIEIPAETEPVKPLYITNIKIVGYAINFDKDVLEYDLDISDDVNELYIETMTDLPDTEIDTNGIVNIMDKDRIVIKVKDNITGEIKGYGINLHRYPLDKNEVMIAKQSIDKEDNNIKLYIIIGVLLILIIGISVYYFIINKKNLRQTN